MGKNNKQIDEEGERRKRMSDKDLILLEFKDFVLFGKEHQIIVKSEDDTKICKLNIDKKKALIMSNAEEMYALLGRVEDYFQNRHIYGYGVEESVSSDLLTKIKEVMKKARGENERMD